ncbi:hypothetical protein GQ42DRAFT_165892 [Ramicandelaber brevisporus]|nr:hypothetical protein GQ42DRAFT_165892 [Ramicandelaber brevisporus]
MRAFASLLCLFAAVASAVPDVAVPVKADVNANVVVGAHVNVHIGGNPFHCDKMAAPALRKRDVDAKVDAKVDALITLGGHKYSCQPGLVNVDADVKVNADAKVNADLGAIKADANVKVNVNLAVDLVLLGKPHQCLPHVTTLKKREAPVAVNANANALVHVVVEATGLHGVLGALLYDCRPLTVAVNVQPKA